MEAEEQTSPYPYLISVRCGRPVAARRDRSYYVCAYETQLGLWWPAREVKVLEYDPHRDFYQEQRQAYLAAHPGAVLGPNTTTPEAAAPGAPTSAAEAATSGAPRWESVDTPPAESPAPPAATRRHTPRHAWGP